MSNETPSPSPERDWTLYVGDMLEFCERAIGYCAGHEQLSLMADQMRYDAVLRNVELIGEAATHVPESIRDLDPAIPWRQIVGTRNRVAHGYLGIEPETVWLIITSSLPDLRIRLAALLAQLRAATP